MSAHDPSPVGEDDLQAYIDSRLDPARKAVVEAWLADDPNAAERVRTDRMLGEQLRRRLAPITADPVPARLRVVNLGVRRASPASRWWPLAAAIVLGLGIGGVGGWVGRGAVTAPFAGPLPPMTQEAVDAYRTFTVEQVHPVEVRANDEPHLVQWLSRRIDRPLRVPDLTAQGFHLMGGRVLPAGDRPAALLMYDDDAGLRLTLYARAVAGADRKPFRYAREGDVAAFSWSGGTVTYVVVARTSEAKLLTIAQSIDHQVDATPSP